MVAASGRVDEPVIRHQPMVVHAIGPVLYVEPPAALGEPGKPLAAGSGG
jgi:hypothetical protein